MPAGGTPPYLREKITTPGSKEKCAGTGHYGEGDKLTKASRLTLRTPPPRWRSVEVPLVLFREANPIDTEMWARGTLCASPLAPASLHFLVEMAKPGTDSMCHSSTMSG